MGRGRVFISLINIIIGIVSFLATSLSGLFIGVLDSGSSAITGTDAKPTSITRIDEAVFTGTVVDQFGEKRTNCRVQGDWIPVDDQARTDQQGRFSVPTTTGDKVVTLACVDMNMAKRTFAITFPQSGGINANFMVPQSVGYNCSNSPWN